MHTQHWRDNIDLLVAAWAHANVQRGKIYLSFNWSLALSELRRFQILSVTTRGQVLNSTLPILTTKASSSTPSPPIPHRCNSRWAWPVENETTAANQSYVSVRYENNSVLLRRSTLRSMLIFYDTFSKSQNIWKFTTPSSLSNTWKTILLKEGTGYASSELEYTFSFLVVAYIAASDAYYNLQM